RDLTFSVDGTWMYLVNGKSVTGPTPGHLASSTGSLGVPQGAPPLSENAAAAAAARASNQYQFQLESASLVSAPVPTPADLPYLTQEVAQNNFYAGEYVAKDAAVMQFLRDRIHDIISIRKENPTLHPVLAPL